MIYNLFMISNCGVSVSLFAGRLAVVVLGLFALALGILLSTLPWVDYIILKVSPEYIINT